MMLMINRLLNWWWLFLVHFGWTVFVSAVAADNTTTNNTLTTTTTTTFTNITCTHPTYHLTTTTNGGNLRQSSTGSGSMASVSKLGEAIASTSTSPSSSLRLLAKTPSSPSSSSATKLSSKSTPSSVPRGSSSSSGKPKKPKTKPIPATTSNTTKISVRFNKYHKYDDMTRLLNHVARKHPNIAKLYSIGKSGQGRELWVMHLTSNINEDVPLKPNVKYVANMHGNEAVGREMMLHLIAYLVNFSNKSTNVRKLLNYTNIHIMPSMNPDGFEQSVEGKCEGPGRRNTNGFDLNRNFPDRIFNQSDAEQPETKAIREWMHRIQFVLSANLHGGALVVNYPFDGSAEIDSEHLEKTPDHDVFIHLATVYAKRHPKLKAQHKCHKNDKFENGITNGNAWYPVQGSMQDYNYIYAGCMELTLEISCCKYPNASNLLSYWNENKLPLLALLGEANRGVKGSLRDHYTEQPIRKANLTILGRDVVFQSDLKGQFWRILMPGDYVLIVKARGYARLQKQFTVTPNKITVMELYLMPAKRLNRALEYPHWRPMFTTTKPPPGGMLNDTGFNSEQLLVADSLILNYKNNHHDHDHGLMIKHHHHCLKAIVIFINILFIVSPAIVFG